MKSKKIFEKRLEANLARERIDRCGENQMVTVGTFGISCSQKQLELNVDEFLIPPS